MKKNCLYAFLFTCMLLPPMTVLAGAGHGKHPNVVMTVTPQMDAVAGTPVSGSARLVLAGKPLNFDDLRVVHTKQFHLLVVDPSLRDYHHLHPVASDKASEYSFTFTPKYSGAYRLWADVTPEATGQQTYAVATMGRVANTVKVDTSAGLEADVAGLHATLVLQGALQQGEATLVSMHISKNGEDFTLLEPVMGAFAHGVGFGQDYQSILHVHPMGVEPKIDRERGGPDLSFHVEPHTSGFVKFFVQVRVDGEDVFFPFGLHVPAHNSQPRS